MYFASARSERSSVENNFRIMPKPHARCTFKTIYKTSAKFPKDRNKIEEELRSQITTHCIRDWQKLKVHKLKKVKKLFDDNGPNQMHILSPWTKHL